MKIQQFTDKKRYIRDFLNLPRKLYRKDENMEDSKLVEDLLTGKHVLNKYFSLYKFVAYSNNQTVARFVITVYPKDHNAYLGFFESIDDDAVAKKIFERARDCAKSLGCKTLIGPVDASFWIKYRLKINNFDKRPYTGEPYNKDYYLKMFLENGFKVCDHYTSNQYMAAQYDYANEEYYEKYREFKEKGYEIKSLELNEFNVRLNELYELITSLYSDFPIYKEISKADFVKIFGSYQKIIDPSMVKFGYKDGKMVGFFISIPNYHNDVYNLNLVKVLRLARLRKNPEGYVMLYIGVNQEYHGLGRALVYSIIQELNKNKKPSIGALAHDGKVTQQYAKDMISDIYEYVILKKEIE